MTLCARQQKRHRCKEQTVGLWKKVRGGWFEGIALKHVYYHMQNRSPVQVCCMWQVLRAGALGWPWGMGWGGRWERVSGWGTYVHTWLIHVNVWQKPSQYCEKKKRADRRDEGKKNKTTCNAGDTFAWKLQGWEDPLEKEVATHSSILAWAVKNMDRGVWWATYMGLQKSWTWQWVNKKQMQKLLYTIKILSLVMIGYLFICSLLFWWYRTCLLLSSVEVILWFSSTEVLWTWLLLFMLIIPI